MTYEEIYRAGYEDGVHDGYYSSSIEDGIEEKHFGKSYQEQLTSDYCVSIEAVLAIAGDSCLDLDSYEDTKEFCDEIRDLPPVTAEPKMGWWVKHDTGYSIYYDCSLCGCAAPCTETADKILWKMANYCSDCGAKMENNGKRWLEVKR